MSTPVQPVSGQPPVVPSPAPLAAGRASDSRESFRDVLRGAASEIARGERLLASTLERGPTARPLDTHELLALQAGVYRYTQQVELVSRLVDRTTQAVKTTLQGAG